MCGLFGLIHTKNKKIEGDVLEKARRALHTLEHRGPDQWSEYVDGNVYMGHRRLSILDLSEAGRQPMKTPDGKTVITVNGEIYNYQNIRAEIGDDKFRSTSDSEVILHGYNALGIESLIDKIDGMYAIVVYDKNNRLLHLVRDRAGVKPLYYARIDDYFIWASELKAIVSFVGEENLHQDKHAIFDFLTYRYIPAPKTVYQHVYKVPPAHCLSLDINQGISDIHCYWKMPVESEPVDHDKAADTLRGLITQSVDEQMMSDVPLGFFLSGGIDSSILVGCAAQKRQDIDTFSIGYDHKAHDETHFADIVARHFGTNHHKEVLSADDSVDLPSRMLGWYDEPFADNSALPTWHVSRFTRKYATVALSGDGADELFGGYRWYDRYMRFSAAQAPVRFLMDKGPRFGFSRDAKGLLYKIATRVDLYSHFDPLELYAALLGGVIGPEKRRWAQRLEIEDDYDALWHFRAHDRPKLSPRKRLQYIDCHTFLPDDIFTKVDRVSMDVSLEARVPYLSREIMEYASTLPEDFLYKGGQLKAGLKYAFRDMLPEEILNRGKKGFSIPIKIWGSKTLGDSLTFEEAVLQRFLSDRRVLPSGKAA